MADILSQLNLTEKELQDNKKQLEEIVRVIDIIKSNTFLKDLDLSNFDNQIIKLSTDIKKNFGDKWIDELSYHVRSLIMPPIPPNKIEEETSRYISRIQDFLSDDSPSAEKFTARRESILKQREVEEEAQKQAEALNDFEKPIEIDIGTLEEKTEQIKEQTQAVENLGKKVQELDNHKLFKEEQKQAEATTEAVKKLTDAEVEAQMRAALSASQKYAEQVEDIDETTEQIEEQTKAVENLGKKIKETSSEQYGFGELLSKSLGLKGYNYVSDKEIMDASVGTSSPSQIIEEIIAHSNKSVDETIKLIKDYAYENKSTEISDAVEGLTKETIDKLKRFNEIDKILDTPEIRKIFAGKEDSYGYKNRLKPGKKFYTNMAYGNGEYVKALMDNLLKGNDVGEEGERYKTFFETLNNKKYADAVNNAPFLRKYVDALNNKKSETDISEQTKQAADKTKQAAETQKQAADIQKQATEIEKQSAEQAKQAAETQKQAAEKTKQTAESSKKATGDLYTQENNKRQNEAIAAARKDSANDILTYFDKQKDITGQDTPLADQLAFYEQQLQEFVDMFGTESDEYIQILKRVRSIEGAIHNKRQKDIEDAFKNADMEQQALQQAAKEKEQAYQSVINGITKVTNVIKNALNHIVNIVRRSINIIKRTITTGFRIVTRITSTIRRLMQLFGSFGNRVKGVQHNGNILKGTFTELKSKIDLLVGAYNKLFNNDYINNGRKLLQSIQTLNITLGKDLTTNTIRWSKELEHAFGVSASGLISDLQGINAVLYGMGMNSQGTELAGRNLLAVGQTLAGITGYDLDTVLEKIESGMKGMTQSIDDLGLSVRESQMDAFLKDLKAQGGEFSNIATSFQNLTEQQRVYVRYASLMTQFRRQFDAEDYVRSLDSITGRLLVLESRFRSLKTTIGNFALQLLDKITIPLASFITFIENRIKALAKLFGIDLEISSGMNKTADGAEKASKNLRNVNNELNDIEETADKAKGSLDAFDHISNISSSDNGSSSPFDYSKLLTIAPDYAQELEDIAKLQDNWLDEQIKKFKEKIKQFIDGIKQKISTWWKDLTGRVINWDEITDNLKKAWSNIKQIFANIKDIAKELFDIIAGLVGMILDDLNFTQLLVDITGLFVSITNFIKEFLATVKPILFDFYEKYLRKYVLKFGVWLHNTILKWTAYFDNLTAWSRSEKGKKDIDNWFDNLGKHIDDLVIKFKAIGKIIQTVFVGEGNAFKDEYTDNGMHQKKSRQQKYAEYDQAGFSRDYIEVADSLNGVFSGLLKVVQDIGRNIAEWWNTPDTGGLAQLKDTLERISTLLNEKHESLARTITNIVLALNDIKQAILDEILDILEWIAANPDIIEKALDAIVKTLSFLIDNITVIVGLIGVAKLGEFILKLLTIYTTLTNISKITASLTGASAGADLFTKFGSVISTVASHAPQILAIAGYLELIHLEIKATINYIKENIEPLIMSVKNLFDAIRGEAVMSTEDVEENAEKMINGLKEKYGEHIPLTGMNQALTEYNNLLVETGNFTQEKVDDYVGYAEKMIIKTGDVYDDTSTSMENTTKRLSERIDESKITISDYESTYKKANNNIKSSNVESQKSITKTTSNITELLKKVTKLASYATNPIKLLVDIQGNMINTGVEKVKNFFGHANGGVPSKGSIFMANENGMPELVSNFGGYTGVANQKMILEAMQNAIGSSMYDAVSSAMNNGGNSQPVNIEICKQGMFVGDDSTVRKLAQKIENVLVTSNKNIGNTRFNFN